EKEYLAVVYGRVKAARGEIDLRLGHDRTDRRRIVAPATVGAASLTRVERVACVAAPRVGLSLLRCRLVTGRRHHIRVHLPGPGRWGLTPTPPRRGVRPVARVTMRPAFVIEVTSMSTRPADPRPTCTGMTFCEQ